MNHKHYSQLALALLIHATIGAAHDARAEAAGQPIVSNKRAPSDLTFAEFFLTPIGDRGLAYTDKLRGLDSKPVRISGYVVQQDKPLPGILLLTARPAQLHEEHYGLADDLPAATLHAIMPPRQKHPVISGRPLTLTGTLSIGNREEPDGRISTVRLLLDAKAFSRKTRFYGFGKGAEQLRK